MYKYPEGKLLPTLFGIVSHASSRSTVIAVVVHWGHSSISRTQCIAESMRINAVRTPENDRAGHIELAPEHIKPQEEILWRGRR